MTIMRKLRRRLMPTDAIAKLSANLTVALRRVRRLPYTNSLK
ncbi:hypothetical protein [Laspinema sp. D2d]|nr:hypothetical protein [Laspinema sp. D2d]